MQGREEVWRIIEGGVRIGWTARIPLQRERQLHRIEARKAGAVVDFATGSPADASRELIERHAT